MATTAASNRFKRDVLNRVIDLSSDTLKWAFYNGSSHDADTTAYGVTNEVSASGTGYTTGGVTASGYARAAASNVEYIDWSDVSIASSTFTATDILLYDDTVAAPVANVAIGIFDFGGERTTNNGAFQIIMPSATSSTAILRLA